MKQLLYYSEVDVSRPAGQKNNYTAIDASANLIACGTNSGSVYLFERGDKSLLKMFTPSVSPHAGVSSISISPTERLVVIGTVMGTVSAISLTDFLVRKRVKTTPEKIEFSHNYHKGFAVCCLLWDHSGTKLFSACNGGIVTVTTTRMGISAIFGNADTDFLIKEETPIVQLDWSHTNTTDMLLVSSQTRVLILQLDSDSASAVQVGTKPRQGSYGACFYSNSDDRLGSFPELPVKVFSVRPGKRIWVAEPLKGKVLSTIKFTLPGPPTNFYHSTNCKPMDSKSLKFGYLSLFEFNKQLQIEGKTSAQFISWHRGGNALFFLDPVNVVISEWHVDLGEIHDLKIISSSSIFVLHGEERKISCIEVCGSRYFLEICQSIEEQNCIEKSIQLALEYEIDDVQVLQDLRQKWNPGDDANDKAQKLDMHIEKLVQKIAEKGMEKNEEIIKQNCLNDQKRTSSIHKLKNKAKKMHGITKLADIDNLKGIDPIIKRQENLIVLEKVKQEEVIQQAKLEQMQLDRNRPQQYLDIYTTGMREVSSYTESMLKKTHISTIASTLITIKEELNNKDTDSETTTTLDIGDRRAFEELVKELDARDVRRRESVDMLVRSDNVPFLQLVMAVGEVNQDDGVVRRQEEIVLEAISVDMWETYWKYYSNLPLDDLVKFTDESKSSPAKLKNKKNNKKLALDAIDAAAMAIGEFAYEIMSPESSSKPEKLSLSSNTRQLSGEDIPSKSVSLLEINSISNSCQTDEIENRTKSSFHFQPFPSTSVNNINSSITSNSISRCDEKVLGLSGGILNASVIFTPFLNSSSSDKVNFEISYYQREYSDLRNEFEMATKQQIKAQKQQQWPANGITRLTAFLVKLALSQSDFQQSYFYLQMWLKCFTATSSEKIATEEACLPPSESSNIPTETGGGWARGEELIGGDGLPLTRSDWSLVRLLVSIYFQLCLTQNSTISVFFASDNSEKEIANVVLFPIKEFGLVLGINLTAKNSEFSTCSVNHDESSSKLSTDKKLPECGNDEETLNFLHRYAIYLNPDVVAALCSMYEYEKSFNFVLNFVLNNDANFLQQLQVYQDFITINNRLESDVISQLRHTADSNRQKLCLLNHLLSLLLKSTTDSSSATLWYCVELYPSITPWNLATTLFGKTNLFQTSTTVSDFWNTIRNKNFSSQIENLHKFYQYLNQLLLQVSLARQNSQYVQNLICLSLAMSSAPPLDWNFLHFKCQYDVNYIWKFVLYGILNCCTKDNFLILMESLIELVFRLHESKIEEAVAFTLDTLFDVSRSQKSHNDICHLVQRFSIRIFNHKEANLLKILLDKLEYYCVNNLVENWDFFFITFFQKMNRGVNHGLGHLDQYPNLRDKMSLNVFRFLFMMAVLQIRQDEDVGNMLEEIDSHVWSNSDPAVVIAPQLLMLVKLEKEHLSSKMHHNSTETSVFNRFYEEFKCSWGVQLQFQDSFCDICSLPLVLIQKDTSESLGVIVLNCGHGFHGACLSNHNPEDIESMQHDEVYSCSLCLDANLTSLLVP